jgi:hypothetical protein
MHHDEDAVSAFLGVSFGTLVFIWFICACAASIVAPRGRALSFFVITLLFLGPLGVGFAAIAVPRDTHVPGRLRFTCPRCVAETYVGEAADEFDCWRCHQRVTVERRLFRGPLIQAASSNAEIAPNTAPRVVEKTTTVKCVSCKHTQKVPVSAERFQCEICDTQLKRKAHVER